MAHEFAQWAMGDECGSARPGWLIACGLYHPHREVADVIIEIFAEGTIVISS